ncbi:putative helicase mov-10-B.1 [Andrena cerasifolii]|uniref:putative helicase mov-10-B.1 n=1 Tax=Andrena cerasifolii TaxID=2819439 RepID=UPI004037AFC6
MASNIETKTRTIVGKSTHCTSFGTCKALAFRNFKPPAALHQAMKNCSNDGLGDSQLCKNYKRFVNDLPNVKTIPLEYYEIMYKILLYMEDYELQLIAEKHNITNQLLRESGEKFIITVLTLDEDDPFTSIGDMVQLQPVGTGCIYHSKIVDIKGKEISVALLSQKHCKKISGCNINVNFCTSRWQIKCFHYVLNVIYTQNLVHFLYPKVDTSYYVLPKDNLNWIHESIVGNPEQKQAVINILNNSAYPAPYILFGPPGTGKTTTLVETICQIRKQQRTKYILVCASSNVAADVIAKRLLAILPSKDVFRMYAQSKQRKDIDKDISPSSNFINDMWLALPKQIFILKKIVITTLVTCTRLVKLNLQYDHFSYIFIDEASQGTELESLIPFTITSSQSKVTEGTLHAQVIIAGDHHQLGPVVRCKKIQHLLGRSLMERLMECEPYQKVKNKYNSRYITKLVRNYRSQEPILHIPNKLFYDNELLCCAKSDMKLSLKLSILANEAFPITFFAILGKEIRCPSGSVYNTEEITAVMYCTKKLMSGKLGTRQIQQQDIGIITPFKRQKIMIDKILNKLGLHNITVGTVETFQGQEKEIIILTTVRTKSFKHDDTEHIGFLSNRKRFNVAVTRAKNALIVIGNPSVLRKDRCWNALWEYCNKNNACMDINIVQRNANSKTKNRKVTIPRI